MSAAELSARRARIDRIDAVLVRLMAARQRQVAHIARLKAGPDNVRDPKRISDILNRVRTTALCCGLEEAIAIPVWRELLERSAEAQQEQLRLSGKTISHLDEVQTAAAHQSRSARPVSSMQAASVVRGFP